MENGDVVKRFSTGAINATVFKNTTKNTEGNDAEFNTVNFSRRFKDKEGNWKSSSSLYAKDLPKAMIVLSKAYEYLTIKE
ncbi:hypothetical protein HOK68_04965 [Candidatus Woesearchaeota archaeon]|jgi:hypothetical protein|nr:hypothetical protein [Candidatus Woesearchaeota archaeon]MBT4387333.1 hypothetical protein [Candidatus Woesearchaeota archaeon]MBT4595472.1 hypothetical protein [Candidatus Woesearchaeota archaeon]MBT5740837.1 hypothetical protein [Candidatus Woesearchaeota archaeon]MBT6506099.1 hypothetical protein [Candidatus Woesearchaeota archaeon]